MKIKLGERMISKNGQLVIVVEQQGHHHGLHWLYCCGLYVDAADFVRYQP